MSFKSALKKMHVSTLQLCIEWNGIDRIEYKICNRFCATLQYTFVVCDIFVTMYQIIQSTIYNTIIKRDLLLQ